MRRCRDVLPLSRGTRVATGVAVALGLVNALSLWEFWISSPVRSPWRTPAWLTSPGSTSWSEWSATWYSGGGYVLAGVVLLVAPLVGIQPWRWCRWSAAIAGLVAVVGQTVGPLLQSPPATAPWWAGLAACLLPPLVWAILVAAAASARDERRPELDRPAEAAAPEVPAEPDRPAEPESRPSRHG